MNFDECYEMLHNDPKSMHLPLSLKHHLLRRGISDV
jgi:hypothetical protein